MSYTVLARRYRSDTFEHLIGQEAIAKTLTNAISSGRIAHAFLFTGVRGVGKTSAARILAKSLNCLKSNAPTAKPCLKCSSCEAVHLGEDIDVIEIDGASNNGVENIRGLRENVVYGPNRARFKIYIIDEVHMLSIGAFNALLKTLEEPPAHVKFIFATTEPHKIPATILSRCQRYDFRTIGEADIAKHLEKILQAEEIQSEPEALAHIARLAAGSMRDALSILDQLLSVGQKKLTIKQVEKTLGMPHFQQVLEVMTGVAGNDVSQSLNGLDELIKLGHSLEQIITALIEHCRNLMLLMACGPKTGLVVAGGENRQALIAQSEKLDVPTVVFFITVLEELRRAVRFSSSARALCEAALVRLAGRENFISAESMMELLESGRPGGPSGGPPQGGTGRATARQTSKPRPAQSTGGRLKASGEPAASPAPKVAADQPLSLELLQQIWPNFVGELETNGNASLAGLLKTAQPTAVVKDAVTVSVRPEYQHLLALVNDETRKAAIRRHLARGLAREIELKFAVCGSADGRNAPAARPSGARVSKEVVEASKRHPLVSKTLAMFNGIVLNVSKNPGAQQT